MQRLDVTITIRQTNFIVIYNNAMIIIGFSITTSPGVSKTLDQLQKKYFPLFKGIANTLVINDKYK
jgi:hypothetical protein